MKVKQRLEKLGDKQMKEQTLLTTPQDLQQIASVNDIMSQAGQAADEAAARHDSADHAARKGKYSSPPMNLRWIF